MEEMMKAKDLPIHNPNHMVLLKRKCRECDKESEITVKFKDHAAWFGGMNIQDAFPYLSVADRELIKTGLCDGCYDAIASIFDKEEPEEGTEGENEDAA